MLAIAEALQIWRANHPNLKGIGVHLDVGPEKEAPYPRSVLTLSVKGTESRSLVPFIVTEKITVGSDVPAGELGAVVQRVIDALDGRIYPTAAAHIHRHAFLGVTFGSEFGTTRTATLSWAGEASVLPWRASWS